MDKVLKETVVLLMKYLMYDVILVMTHTTTFKTKFPLKLKCTCYQLSA